EPDRPPLQAYAEGTPRLWPSSAAAAPAVTDATEAARADVTRGAPGPGAAPLPRPHPPPVPPAAPPAPGSGKDQHMLAGIRHVRPESRCWTVRRGCRCSPPL